MDPDDFLLERTAEKVASIASVEAALTAIERQRREPDPWERFHLAQAFVMIFNGIYRAAPIDVDLAMLPPAERVTTMAIPAVFGDCTLTVLREALRAVKAEPVRPFPHVGPVRLTGADRQP
ncbi:MAG TPA: hypothetical protein VN802_12910 [Stellaceae bacterium]|nr:hypothetical protein [Stellaceae bacterium]